MEALLIGTSSHRQCLNFDEASGIMLVTEDEPGYTPFGERPPDPQAAQAYCQAWNANLGLTPDDMLDIIASSMFGRKGKF